MHAPWLQITKEVRKVSAPQLAADLDVSVGDAYLMLSDLIDWGLARCPEDRPPSASGLVNGPSAARQVAQAMGWRGNPAKLIEALEGLPHPILEVLPEGLRIRGLKRYDHHWVKSYPAEAKAWKDSHPGGVGAEAVPVSAPKPGRNRADTAPPDPDPDPDPDLRYHHHQTSSSATEVPGPPPVVVVVGEVWEGFAAARRDAGLGPEGDSPPKEVPGWCAARGREGFTARDQVAGYRDFLVDPTIRSKTRSAAVFVRNCWRSRLRHLEPEPAPPAPNPLEIELDRRLEPVRNDGHAYAATQLREFEPVAIVADRLHLRATDAFKHSWAEHHYGQIMDNYGLLLLPLQEAAQ